MQQRARHGGDPDHPRSRRGRRDRRPRRRHVRRPPVEEVAVDELFADRCHPYTTRPDGRLPRRRAEAAAADRFPGTVPPLWDAADGLRFAPRCPRRVRPLPEPSARPSSECTRSSRACWEPDARLTSRRVAPAALPCRSKTSRSTSPSAQGSSSGTVGHGEGCRRRVSFSTVPGETLGLVGESGCGKSTLGLAAAAARRGRPGGRVAFDGAGRRGTAQRERSPPAQRMQIVFQDPFSRSIRARRSRDIIRASRSTSMASAPRPSGAREVRELLDAGRPAPPIGRPLPARVLRRPAPAHRHRPRAGAPSRSSSSATSRSRRSTFRSRPRSSTCWPTSSSELGLTLPLHLARSRRGASISRDRVAVMYLGKIVETGPSEGDLRQAAASLYRAAAALGPSPDPRRQAPIQRRQRRRAERHEQALRLRLPHPLSARDRNLPGRLNRSLRRSRKMGRSPWPAIIDRTRSRVTEDLNRATMQEPGQPNFFLERVGHCACNPGGPSSAGRYFTRTVTRWRASIPTCRMSLRS